MSEFETAHLPPQNIEAEEAILGAMMVSQTAREIVGESILEAEDFYRPKHRTIFDAIVSLEARGEPIDELVVINELKHRNTLEEVGGRLGVLSISERVPAAANARAYAEEVLRQSHLRAVAEAGRKAMQIAMGDHDVEGAIAAAEALLFGIRDRLDGLGVSTRMSMADALASYVDRYQVVDGDAGRDVVPVCIPELEESIGGWRRGQVVVVGAYSGDRKTWFGLDVLESFARAGERGAVFTMEMSGEELAERLVAMNGADYTKLRRGQLPFGVWSGIRDAVAALPIDVFDTPRCTVATIRSEVARARAAGRPYRVVVVDHFHLLDWPGPGHEKRNRQEDGLRELKAMAKQFGFTLVLLAQLNEVEASRENPFPPPTLRSLRDTRALVHIADYVIFLWQEREGQRLTGVTKVKLAKTRDLEAQTSTVTVTFQGYRLRVVHAPSTIEAPRPEQQELGAGAFHPEFPGVPLGATAYTDERGA